MAKMSRGSDLTGKTFGRLTVKEFSGRPPGQHARWLCQCECGNIKVVRSNSLLGGQTLSCGCLQREKAKKECENREAHGHANRGRLSSEYHVYHSMLKRCFNPNCRQYAGYGGRGIKVCERWRNSFESFLEDMGPKPTPKHTLERKENDGDYEPGNCRWATRKEQNRNKRNNRLLTHNGQTRCLMEWSEITGIHWGTLLARLARQWPVERTLTTPTRKMRRTRPCQRAQALG